MNRLTQSALLALSIATLGGVSLLPAYAQTSDSARVEKLETNGAHGFRPHQPRLFGGMPRSGIVEMLLSARGAEAIEIAAIRLTYALDLTEGQQALLEDLRLAALDAQSDVDAARQDIVPISEDEVTQESLTARYAGLIAMTTARAEALESLQPALVALIESLSDEQIMQLTPGRPMPPANSNGEAPALAETPQPDGSAT